MFFKLQRLSAALALTPVIFLLVWWANGFSVFKWDAIWYRDIVAAGPSFNGNILQQNNVAFLPGYSLLVSAFHYITQIGVEASQYFVSLLCYFGGCFFFYKVFCQKFGAGRGAWIIVLFSFSPFSIYLFNGYSETVLYLLCGVFFFGIASGRCWLSALALSFALITRPHAAALYPVLIYRLANDQGLFSHGGEKPKRDQVIVFLRACVDHVILSLVFPMALTCFWYFRFGDSLVYLNALTAWGNGASSSALRMIGVLVSSLIQIQTIEVQAAGSAVKLMAPHQMAAWSVLLNILATGYLVKKKAFEFAIFNASLLLFWLLTSDSANSGRHALMLFALPIAVSLLTSSFFQDGALPDADRGWAGTMMQLAAGALAAGVCLFVLLHFIGYALVQLNGGWIS